MLQEENGDSYGGRSEESLDNDGTARGSRLSPAVRWGISGKHSSDLDENEEEQEHFLDHDRKRALDQGNKALHLSDRLPVIYFTLFFYFVPYLFREDCPIARKRLIKGALLKEVVATDQNYTCHLQSEREGYHEIQTETDSQQQKKEGCSTQEWKHIERMTNVGH